jgi:hypothetical protein
MLLIPCRSPDHARYPVNAYDAADLAARVLAEPQRVTLSTFAEGQAVELELLEGSTGYGEVTTTVVVRPRSALGERWYSLSVDVPAPVLGGLRAMDESSRASGLTTIPCFKA